MASFTLALTCLMLASTRHRLPLCQLQLGNGPIWKNCTHFNTHDSPFEGHTLVVHSKRAQSIHMKDTKKVHSKDTPKAHLISTQKDHLKTHSKATQRSSRKRQLEANRRAWVWRHSKEGSMSRYIQIQKGTSFHDFCNVTKHHSWLWKHLFMAV